MCQAFSTRIYEYWDIAVYRIIFISVGCYKLCKLYLGKMHKRKNVRFFFFNYHKDYRIQVSNSVMGGEPIQVGAFLSTTVLGLPY